MKIALRFPNLAACPGPPVHVHFMVTRATAAPARTPLPNSCMKHLAMLIVFGAAPLVFSACQNSAQPAPDNFAQKTHRTYNPETGSYEQSPPWGKQSNKSDTQ